jgi:hypothetical protein
VSSLPVLSKLCFEIDIGEYIVDVIIVSGSSLKGRNRLPLRVNHRSIVIGLPGKVSEVAIDHKTYNCFFRGEEVRSKPGCVRANGEAGKIVFQVPSFKISMIIKIPVEIKMIEALAI